jgi:OmpA-OmpF porin, OOP family
MVKRGIRRAGISAVFGMGLGGILAIGCGGDPPPPPLPPPDPPPVVVAPPPPPPAPEPPPPEPIKLPAPVKFATGSAQLAAESDAVLKHVLEYLQKSPDTTLLRVEGHTDNQGGPGPNQKLSEGRAMSVAAWLVKNGVDCKRIQPVGFGESKPVADNGSEEGRAQNRRTVFIDAEHKGKKVGSEHGGQVAGDPCAKKL